MTTSGLASPLPAVRPREARAEPPDRPSPLLFRTPDKPSFLRVYGRALAFSTALHLAVLAFSPFLVVIDVPGVGSGALAPSGDRGGQTGLVEIALFPPSEIVPLSQVSPGVSVTPGTASQTVGGVAMPAAG